MRRLAFASLSLVSILGLGLGLGLAGCQTAGDRSSTGKCPDGQTCSTLTPQGLDFRGPDYADDWFADATIKPTALGGAETISIINAEDQQLLAFPYTAKLGNDDLTADAPNGALLTLHGQDAGTALLQIDGASDGLLFDQVNVTATAITTADVVAFHDEALLAGDPPPALMMGNEAQLLARLWDSSGIHRVVDQALAIGVSGQNVTPMTWDTVALTPTAVGDLAVTLSAGGQQHTVGAISVVDDVDGLVPGWSSFDTSNPPRASQSLVACVEAQKDGAPVVGLQWTMSATGADSASPWIATNCMSFTRNTAGTVTIHGSAYGLGADFVIQVGAAAQPDLAPITAPRPQGTPGDYARSFDDARTLE